METPIKLNVTGMTCGGCENSVKKVISRHFNIDVSKIEASHEEDKVVIHETIDNIESVFESLEDIGFPASIL